MRNGFSLRNTWNRRNWKSPIKFRFRKLVVPRSYTQRLNKHKLPDSLTYPFKISIKWKTSSKILSYQTSTSLIWPLILIVLSLLAAPRLEFLSRVTKIRASLKIQYFRMKTWKNIIIRRSVITSKTKSLNRKA